MYPSIVYISLFMLCSTTLLSTSVCLISAYVVDSDWSVRCHMQSPHAATHLFVAG